MSKFTSPNSNINNGDIIEMGNMKRPGTDPPPPSRTASENNPEDISPVPSLQRDHSPHEQREDFPEELPPRPHRFPRWRWNKLCCWIGFATLIVLIIVAVTTSTVLKHQHKDDPDDFVEDPSDTMLPDSPPGPDDPPEVGNSAGTPVCWKQNGTCHTDEYGSCDVCPEQEVYMAPAFGISLEFDSAKVSIILPNMTDSSQILHWTLNGTEEYRKAMKGLAIQTDYVDCTFRAYTQARDGSIARLPGDPYDTSRYEDTINPLAYMMGNLTRQACAAFGVEVGGAVLTFPDGILLTNLDVEAIFQTTIVPFNLFSRYLVNPTMLRITQNPGEQGSYNSIPSTAALYAGAHQRLCKQGPASTCWDEEQGFSNNSILHIDYTSDTGLAMTLVEMGSPTLPVEIHNSLVLVPWEAALDIGVVLENFLTDYTMYRSNNTIGMFITGSNRSQWSGDLKVGDETVQSALGRLGDHKVAFWVYLNQDYVISDGAAEFARRIRHGPDGCDWEEECLKRVVGYGNQYNYQPGYDFFGNLNGPGMRHVYSWEGMENGRSIYRVIASEGDDYAFDPDPYND